MKRLLKLLPALLALGLLAVWASPSWAAEKAAQDTAKLARGTVKSVKADQREIVVTDKEGKNWTFRVLDHAAIFIPNEANPKLSDLKSGEDVSVLYTKKGDQAQVGGILLHQGDFKNCELAVPTIKNVGTDNTQFTVNEPSGKEATYYLAPNAKVHQNGKAGKLSDFKANEHVIVVWDKEGNKNMVKAMCDNPFRSR